MNTAHLLVNAARSFPSQPAISLGAHTVFRYTELAERTAHLAAAIDRLRGAGEVIAIASDNCIEYMEILYAGWHAGVAVAPMNARLNPSELAYMIKDCGAKIAFVNEAIKDDLAALLPAVHLVVPGSLDYQSLLEEQMPLPLVEKGDGELAWIFYTSGTTGKPKGAMLSHGNLTAMTFAYYADIDFLDENDALLHIAATSHASGLFGLSFVAKAANNIIPESGGFDADEVAALIEHYQRLSFFMPPTILRRLDKYPAIAGANPDHIKTVLLGAAPMTSGDIRNGYKLFGPKLWNGYGQGESPCTITAMSKSMIARAVSEDRDDRLSSVGIVRTGMQLDIVDDEGCSLPESEIGEVIVKGPTVMEGYLNRPDATRDTIRSGWLYTGDVGFLDAQGYLTLLDRKKDVIISGGMNIYAREVEDVLIQSPEVLEVAVIGIPDPEWGESVVAIVVPSAKDRPDKARLDQLCLESMARFKRPKQYAFVKELPKNTSGKVLKRELREKFANMIDAKGV